jgi:hypothetical protein
MEVAKTTRQIVLLQRLAEARDRVLRSIASLGLAVLCTEPVVGDWTVKDLLGHMVAWNREFRACIHLIRQGQHPGYRHRISGDHDFNHWNRRQMARTRDWTWRRVGADFDQDYKEAVALILRLEPQGYRKRGVTPWKRAAVDRPAVPATADTESVETLVTYHWRHMNQHARMIERWRKQRRRKRRERTGWTTNR